MFRLLFRTFFGECRASEEVKHHIHESPKVMTIPLMILAVLSRRGRLGGGTGDIGRGEQVRAMAGARLRPSRNEVAAPAIDFVGKAYAAGGGQVQGSAEGTLMVAAIVVALLGIFVAYYLYMKRTELPGAVRDELPVGLPHGP